MDKKKIQPVYTNEFRNKMVKRMLPPENISPKDLSKESGISRSSLSIWLKKAKSMKTVENNKTEIEWISLNISNEDTKIPKIESVKVKIGVAAIEVETGFNKDLLLDLMRVVAKI